MIAQYPKRTKIYRQVRPFAPAIIGAFVAIAAACAGFHEPPSLFQLVGMVTGAALAALVARIKKSEK
jgi:hypothetical protein